MDAIRLSVSIKCNKDKVYSALTEKSGLSNWWTQRVQISGSDNAVLEFDFEEEGSCKMRIEKLDPPSRVEWACVDGPQRWLDTTIIFELVDKLDQTLLRFDQRGWQEVGDFYRYCSVRWTTYLLSLKWYLETGAGKPYPNHIKL